MKVNKTMTVLAVWQYCMEILGLEPFRIPNNKEARKQYRKLAITYHPDINNDPNAEDEMVRLNEVRDFLDNNATIIHQQFKAYLHSCVQTYLPFTDIKVEDDSDLLGKLFYTLHAMDSY